jgi:hypothetical protein
MALVCKRIRGEGVNLFDPCCGEGHALKMLSDTIAGSVTYGVELEKGRARAAKNILDHVVHCGYESIRMSHGKISACWLNPPYDSHDLERTEVRFLRDLTAPNTYLHPGALLMFVVPQYVLAPAAAFLANRFEKVRVYRFTDENYPVYSQVVVFGYRREDRPNLEEVRALKARLNYLAGADLPDLAEPDGVTFDVPVSPGPVTLFRGSVLDSEEIAKDVEASPVWELVDEVLLPKQFRGSATMKRPLLPLKPAHMGVAIAAGVVGGNMGTHIITGSTKKVTDRSRSDDEDATTIVEIDRHVTTIRVFSQEGVTTLE